jgi:hypothetical protein
MPKAASSKVASVRREYETAKRQYKKAGKTAFGKSKKSSTYREYQSAKRTYKKVGSLLGHLTGKKPRR